MKIIITLVMLSGFFISKAQDEPIDLKERIDQYFIHNKNKDFDSIMEYIHPSMFRLVTKEQLIEAFRQSFSSETMDIGFDSLAIKDIGRDIVFEKAEYRKVNYLSRMYIILKNMEDLEEESVIELLVDNLKSAFPGAEVKFNRERKSFDVNTIQLLLAIKEPESPWNFIGIDKSKPEFIKMLLPGELIKMLELIE